MEIIDIIDTFDKSKKPTGKMKDLKPEPGIYCFYLKQHANLDRFGQGGQAIYLGVSLDLNGREINQHLKTGETGWSSFRRSIGAILKNRYKMTAERRDPPHVKKLRADKYKFDREGEVKITDWIISSTDFAYWISPNLLISKSELEKLELLLLKQVKPTLDLDRRTKHLNPLAADLDQLRKICREEVRSKSLL